MIYANKKGQAVAEMAIFGTLILLIFGVLLSFIQQLNDRQYTQMEAFRRALAKANSYTSDAEDGSGASVQYTLAQNRHQINLAGGYRQGSNVTQIGSANVYWAIPKSAKGSSAESLLVFRINEDEGQFKYNDFIPEAHRRIDPETGEERPVYWVLQTENMDTDSDTLFKETNVKSEDTYAITNKRTSRLKDDITTAVPYKIVEKKTGDKDYESTVEEGILYEVKQGAYLDPEGQYKYSQQAAGNEITREKTWVTPF